MRKITKESINAFLNEFTFNKQNMSVSVAFGRTHSATVNNHYEGNFNFTELKLHGNTIAYKIGEDIFISNCGWESNTTKERLNSLINEYYGYPTSVDYGIYQKNFVWYLNEVEWDGKMTKLQNR